MSAFNINLCKIAVVDDKPENYLTASVVLRRLFPETQIYTFESAIKFIQHFGDEQCPFDIVFSDMEMEREDSGKLVAYSSWRWRVPTVIVTGGLNHGKPNVMVPNSRDSYIDGDKSSEETWVKIINRIFIPNSNLIYTIIMGKVDSPSEDIAEVGLIATLHGLL